MVARVPVRAVITGGPGAGKSTLLDELARRGFAVETEVARAILQQPGGMELRASDPLGFAHAMFEREVRSYRDAEGSDGPVVFDRGFPDIAGFLRVEGLSVPDTITRACQDWRYNGPIFRAPPWPAIFRQDDQRIQDWEAALASDAAVTAAWRDHGYAPIDLPLVTVGERADWVEAKLGCGGQFG